MSKYAPTDPLYEEIVDERTGKVKRVTVRHMRRCVTALTFLAGHTRRIVQARRKDSQKDPKEGASIGQGDEPMRLSSGVHLFHR